MESLPWRCVVKGQTKAGVKEEKTIKSCLSAASVGLFRYSFRFLCAALIVAILVSQGSAQTATPALQGRVLDPSNSAVACAQVTAIPEGRTTGVSTISDQ